MIKKTDNIIESYMISLSIISLIISAIALIVSYLSFKRTGEINKPKYVGVYSGSKDTFNFMIDDYSTGKNLRIDSITVKNLKLFSKYVPVKFDVELNTNNNPQRSIIHIHNDIIALNSYQFKIKTNHGNIKYKYNGIFK